MVIEGESCCQLFLFYFSNKPIIFLNTNDFYEYFFLFINNIRKEGFVSKAYDGLYVVVSTVEEAVEYIENYQAKDFSSKY